MVNTSNKPDHIPGFEAQGATVTRIRNEELSGVANSVKYNGGMVRWKNKVIMAYRRFDPDKKYYEVDPATNERRPYNVMNIAISELNELWQPNGTHYVPTMPYRRGNERYEDPRLFVFDRQLYLAVVEAKINPGYAVSQRLFRLDDNYQIAHVLDIKVGDNFKGNGFSEKNWTYFEQDGKLYLLYDVHQMQVYQVNPKSGVVIATTQIPRLHWPYGFMRGGTCPVKLPDGNWLKIVHSSTDTPWSPTGGQRRYSMSAVIFSPEPPFKPLLISKDPFLYGSRHEWWCGAGCSQCIFPAGLILDGDMWHISAGVNDSYNAVLHYDGRKLMQGMVDASEFDVPRKRFFFSNRPNSVQTIVGQENLWRPTRVGSRGREGIIATQDPFSIAELLAAEHAKELTEAEYDRILKSVSGGSTIQDDYSELRKPKKIFSVKQ